MGRPPAFMPGRAAFATIRPEVYPVTRRILALVFLLLPAALRAEETLGYYRFPAIHGDTIVFAAEGDLWRVDRRGGIATRLTPHPAEESPPAISPDGKTLAFSATYEGPTEVYTMPVDGGLPVRRTFEGEGGRTGAVVVGWTPGGEVLYATAHESGLPGSSWPASIRPREGAPGSPWRRPARGSIRRTARRSSSPA